MGTAYGFPAIGATSEDGVDRDAEQTYPRD